MFSVQMKNGDGVASKSRKQTVRTETAVRKQTKAALPIVRYGAIRQRFSGEKIGNPGRNERICEFRTDNNDRFSGERIRQLMPGIKQRASLD